MSNMCYDWCIFSVPPFSSLPQVIEGYEKACKKTLEILSECVCSSAKNLHDINEAKSLIRTAVMSKQYGNEDFLANLIAEACGESEVHTISDFSIALVFFWLPFSPFFVQYRSSQSLAISMLITSEYARFW